LMIASMAIFESRWGCRTSPTVFTMPMSELYEQGGRPAPWPRGTPEATQAKMV
jgi:hypothetical protein